MSASAFAGVSVSSPTPGSHVGSPVKFVASATSSTGHPIASMIIYVDNVKKYTTYSASLSTSIAVSGTGWHNIIIKAWDSGGTIYQAGSYGVYVSGTSTTTSSSDSGSSSVTTSTSSAPSGSTVFSNIDQMSGWQACDACAGVGGAGPSGSYSMTQNQSSPSMDGRSMKFYAGGSTPYTDYLFHKQLVSESQLSKNRATHHFIYDTYMYVQDPTVPQNIEWDINQFVDGKSYIWGTQCAWRSTHTWDIWDNINNRWVNTGIYCALPKAYAWNHVVLEMERTSDNKLHYISVSLNGAKHILNKYYSPKSTSWSGITVNYQLDGNNTMQHYSTWLDKFNLTIW